MAGVNLTRGTQKDKSKETPLVGGAFLFSIGLLIFVGVVYGGFLAFNGFLNSRMDSQRQTITDAETKLNSPESSEITDFARRSEEVSKHLPEISLPATSLEKLERTILPSVNIVSYEWSGDGLITLSLSAESMKSASQQLAIFKTNFNSVNVQSIENKQEEGQSPQFVLALTMTDKQETIASETK